MPNPACGPVICNASTTTEFTIGISGLPLGWAKMFPGKNVSGQKTLTIIIDSMDRSKWALPRSEALMSKHLGTMHRPNLDVTAAICHGHLCAIYFAEPSIVKGSSWTCEVLCNLLHCLCMQGVDLREYEVCVHGDNCSKEINCNSIARLLSLLVSRRQVRRAQLPHTLHDQFFQ